ncbi:type II secretion system F family protein [Pseudarthrobacter psychrotolerans]|uniref:Type II secretion system F family protein n=1 Tax=Pseudarthrobacter psychrotolerans TaxID=2697569 RepID=A0A6P1NKP0_9MICC|nr:type II secretion system F family protein [Pseudarthrobacter psychrotolerans]QHK19908.1 type II secretion system F family protein [Pseudarthrobacter psychrotolerans]
MTTMAWLIVGLIVLPCAFLVWSLVAVDRRGFAAVRNNLGRGLRLADGVPVGTGSSSSADAKPSIPLGMRLTPKGYTGWLDKILARAGRPARLPLERVLVAKPALALVVGVLGIVTVIKSPSPQSVLFVVLLAALAYFVPDILIHGRGAERQKAIELELPNTLDQMLISVEAGLGFETAMARAGQNGKGPLAAELMRTLQDMQVGRSRRDAYLGMAARTDVPDLRSFVRAVVQADVYGIAIANVLRAQAKQMRVKRRQRAEEKAMKLPVKVLFPLMFCILPVLFIVIIGPAAINVMKNFVGAF